MSRTDRDAPYWVHVTRTGVPTHDHRHGVCDFEPLPRKQERLQERGWRYRWTCGLEIPGLHYWSSLKYYPRATSVQFYSREKWGGDRSRLHRSAGEIKKLFNAGEDVSNEEIVSPPHWHSGYWEMW